MTMFLQILDIVAPVFLIIAVGYVSVRKGGFADNMVDGLMKFAIQFAVPCLLFQATSTMDLKAVYDWNMMLSFYVGASGSFFIASILVWKFFNRQPRQAVAVGFSALFSNTVLLGLSISERAWGVANISPVYAIVSIHAPFCYLLGITTMELLGSNGWHIKSTSLSILKGMFSNSLMIGIGLGFLVNLSGLSLPQFMLQAVDTLSSAALPAALFGLGGVLSRYKLTDSMAEVSLISVCSLFLHPLITFSLCYFLGVADAIAKMAILVAAMAPGVNGYLFANMYQSGQGTAASTVLFATAVSIFSVSAWLWVLA